MRTKKYNDQVVRSKNSGLEICTDVYLGITWYSNILHILHCTLHHDLVLSTDF